MTTTTLNNNPNTNPHNLPIDSVKKRTLEDYNWKRVFFFNFMRWATGVFLSLLYKVEIYGKEHIPTHQQFILTSNHQSNWDPVLLGKALKQNLAFIAKKELFLAHPVLFFAYDYMGCVAVDREKVDISTIRSAKTVAKLDNWILSLFPEGTRNKKKSKEDSTDTTENMEGKKGAAFFAKSTQSDILPVGIRYETSGFRKRAIATIGAPIPYQKGMDVDTVTEQLMSTIQTLSQQN